MASLSGFSASLHALHTSDAVWRLGWLKFAAIIVRTSYGRAEKSRMLDEEEDDAEGEENRDLERELLEEVIFLGLGERWRWF